jgi:cyclic pyranopterin phosphate synthase
MEIKRLSHIDNAGKAHMVNVTNKAPTYRIAVAKCEVILSNSCEKFNETVQLYSYLERIQAFEIARQAGIQSSKRTSELIPLCHPLQILDTEIQFLKDPDRIGVESRLTTFHQTGIEMEALVACCCAALTLVNMLKSKNILVQITNLALWEKHGGKSGSFVRNPS